MAMAPTVKVVLGSIAFAIFWVLAVFPAVPFMPIGRTAGSLLGAMLMVLFQVITPDQAFAAIDLPILGLLFGTMVVSAYLERADIFKYLGKLLSWRSKGAKDLLCRICMISAVSSALFTNDTSCVVLTEFVLKIARQHNLPPHPFLLALASSANIGSSATPIGNPQNLVIAVQSKISFGKFLIGVLPAMLVGVVINALILLCMYWKLLSDQKDEEDASVEVVGEEDVSSHRFSPATMSHLVSLKSQDLSFILDSMGIHSPANVNGLTNIHSPVNVNGHESTLKNRGNIPENDSIHSSPNVNVHTDKAEKLRNRGSLAESDIHKVLNPGVESIRNSDASRETTNSVPILSKSGPSSSGVEYENFGSFTDEKLGFSKKWKIILWKACVYLVTLGMLVSLLLGLNMSWTAITAALALIVLDFKDARPSLEKTGIPSSLWEFMEPYAKIDSVWGTAILAVVIVVLSNVASNVPTVLLLGARVAASAAAISPASEKKAWLILAWVSTVAGNMSLLGSAANLIVCEQARRCQHYGYNLSFWKHLKFGFPSTIVITTIGLILIRG